MSSNVFNFSKVKPEDIEKFIPGYTEEESVVFVKSASGRIFGMKENPNSDAYLCENSEPSYLIVGPNAKETYIFCDENKFVTLCETPDFTLYEFRGKIALSDSRTLSPDDYIVVINSGVNNYVELSATELDADYVNNPLPMLPNEAQLFYTVSLNQYTLPQTWKPLMS